jgi:hypothetical protein
MGRFPLSGISDKIIGIKCFATILGGRKLCWDEKYGGGKRTRLILVFKGNLLKIYFLLGSGD